VLPTLLSIGRFELPSYGVLVALGILVGTVVAVLLGRRAGLGADFAVDAVFWMVLGGFAAARLVYMGVNWQETLRDPAGAVLSGGGFVFIAGGVGGAAVLWVLCRRRGVPFPAAADMLAPAVAVAHAFGRVGCFLSGCCYGRVTPAGWEWAGVRYPKLIGADGTLTGSSPYVDQLKHGLVSRADAFTQPVYPVQLIEAGFDLLVFLVLLSIWRRRTGDGRVFVAYILLYAAGRFLLEFLRGDVDRGIWHGLSLSQWSCLAIMAAATWYVLGLKRPGRAHLSSACNTALRGKDRDTR
jgi:phosphatidylglycerol---prolipoprotein diacylglyceryl transferase